MSQDGTVITDPLVHRVIVLLAGRWTLGVLAQLSK